MTLTTLTLQTTDIYGLMKTMKRSHQPCRRTITMANIWTLITRRNMSLRSQVANVGVFLQQGVRNQKTPTRIMQVPGPNPERVAHGHRTPLSTPPLCLQQPLAHCHPIVHNYLQQMISLTQVAITTRTVAQLCLRTGSSVLMKMASVIEKILGRVNGITCEWQQHVFQVELYWLAQHIWSYIYDGNFII